MISGDFQGQIGTRDLHCGHCLKNYGPISSPTSCSLYNHVKSVSQNLKTKRNFIEIVVPCFFFHNKLFKTL